ncbi:MAG: mucoidy inhibitor MuiA family protein [Pseudomonadota bacterium]
MTALRLISPRTLAAALMTSVALPAMADTIDASSDVARATVYPGAAAVTREARFVAPAGSHEIVLEDLPLRIEPDSLRVEGAGTASFAITGISYRRKTRLPEPLPVAEREALEAEIRALEWEHRSQKDLATAASDRIRYMEAFRKATLQTGPSSPFADGAPATPRFLDNIENWPEAWGMITREAVGAQDDLAAAERRIEELDEQLGELLDRLADTDRHGPPRSVLTVSIETTGPVTGGLEITYLTRQANWSPLYDLRLDQEADQKRLTVIRRAEVRQSTGEDWSDIKLSLSTARPSGRLAAQKPPLAEAAIAPDREEYDGAGGLVLSDAVRSKAQSAGEYARNILPAQEALTEAPAAPEPAVQPSALTRYEGATIVFEIETALSLPGDGEVRQALIGETAIDTNTMIRATPVVDESAYLYAVYQNDAAPLLPGRASLYRDGAYLGQHTLDYVAPGEKSALPFGPMESVVVKRSVKQKLSGEEGVFTTSNKERSRFVLTARNLGADVQTVTLFDALPYTETDEIDIDLVTSAQPTERDVDGRRGALAWTFSLKPGAERVIEFGYDIAWPDGQRLQVN